MSAGATGPDAATTPGGAPRPNVVVVLADDLGYSDISCYGGEIPTPSIDRLAAGGVRFSQFYNTARCSPSRASLLTGLHPHQTGIGVLTHDDGPGGYRGTLNDRCVTIPEALGPAGYRCYMSGKWHLSAHYDGPAPQWPRQRGFDRFFGTIAGAASYYHPWTLVRDDEDAEAEALQDGFYYTDAISDAACGFIDYHCRAEAGRPFFLYVAYTAPHWPLHAPPSAIEPHRGRFDEGWDRLRSQRLERLVEMGMLSAEWPMTERDPEVAPWDSVGEKLWERLRMEVYAGQVQRMDQGIGRITQALTKAGVLEDTIVIFLSDNGGCAEELGANNGVSMASPGRRAARLATRAGAQVAFGNTPAIAPGPESTYSSYGRAWANLSNTPFREYKRWVHEGGIATPFVLHWPSLVPDPGGIRHQAHQLTDLMPTILEAAGATYPSSTDKGATLALEGRSMRPSVLGDPGAPATLFWEHLGNSAARRGPWKLVRKFQGPWELYHMERGRTETKDLSGSEPALVAELAAAYEEWAARCGVIPRERILGLEGKG